MDETGISKIIRPLVLASVASWVGANVIECEDGAKLSENHQLESNTTAGCTDGWVSSHSDASYCVQVLRKELNFTEAQNHCWKNHSRLASFRDVEEFESLRNLCGGTECWLRIYHIGKRLPSLPNYPLHFTDGSPYALVDEHDKLWGKYYTKDGNPVRRDEANSTFETAYEPSTRSEHCAIVRFLSDYYINGDGLLNDIHCSSKIPAFVCKRRAAVKELRGGGRMGVRRKKR